MDMDTLHKLNELVEKYSRHRGFVERARAQSSKFSSSVIEKVIHDHEAKSSEVAAEILPLVPKIEASIGALDADAARVAAEKGDVHNQLEELELRQAIGELDEAEFDSLTTEFRAAVSAADDQLAELARGKAELEGALNAWVSLARSAGQADGRGGIPAAPKPVQPPAPPPRAAAPVVVAPVAPVTLPPVPVAETSAMQTQVPEAGDEAPVIRGVRDDLREVIQAAAPAVSEPEEDQGNAIEVIEAKDEEIDPELPGWDPAPSANPFGGDDGEVVIFEDEPVAEDDSVDIEGPAVVEAPQASSDEPRRALLLYQEGTAEEQIYPFTGEVLTIGRGRDNDIQIKNDSKVSRFHCKLFRRGNSFFVEDNKSSNGTLVNGELITERRLFGGEEVIIGETFFRFRIL